MAAHRQLVISLVLYGASFAEVFAESIDESCSLPDAQQPSQGEALLQGDFKRATAHQQLHDKTKMGPHGLELLSHGKGKPATLKGKPATKLHEKELLSQSRSKGKPAATAHENAADEESVKAFVNAYGLQKHLDKEKAEKAAKKSSKNEVKECMGEDCPGDDEGDAEDVDNESEKKEKPAKKKATQGKTEKPKKLKKETPAKKGKAAKTEETDEEATESAPKVTSGSVSMAGAESEDSENAEGKEEHKSDKKSGHGDKKGKADKKALLDVDNGEKSAKKAVKAKGTKPAIKKKQTPKDVTNSDNDPPGLEPKRPRKWTETKTENAKKKKEEELSPVRPSGENKRHKK